MKKKPDLKDYAAWIPLGIASALLTFALQSQGVLAETITITIMAVAVGLDIFQVIVINMKKQTSFFTPILIIIGVQMPIFLIFG
jgi:hypothetical protein